MYCQYISYIFFSICTIFYNIFHFFSDILCTMCYVKIVNYYSFTERAVLLMIKKHFKKLVSVALTAVMALGMTTTAFANEKDTLNLDAALMEKGYPQIVLDTMDEDTKMDIYNEGDIAFCATICRFRTRYRSSPQSQTTPLQARPLPILQRLLYAWHNSPWLSSPYPHEHACTLRLSLFPLLPYSSPHLAFHVIAIMQVIYIA